ncbi:MAG: putative alpha/beta superfamily hydrolase [Oleispira sp.]|jgi:predicted alpha/beta superfamily hydrolase
MTILKPMQLVITTMLLLVCSTIAFGQKLEPKDRKTEPDHTIFSKIRGRNYQLYISFPTNYSTKDTITYPVLYVLDGEYAFPTTRGTREILDWGNKIEDVIIVGIGSGLNFLSWYNDRFDDYTTSRDTVWENDANYGKNAILKGSFTTGGAAEFLKSIKTEIIPFVDNNYKTNSDRGITGHSAGGLFTAYCLINSDGYFTRFGISSPSFWWDNNKLLNQSVTQFRKNKIWDIPQTKIFISCGEYEGIRFIPSMQKIQTSLENADYQNIELSCQIFDGESHLSVWPANISKTLITLYGKK